MYVVHCTWSHQQDYLEDGMGGRGGEVRGGDKGEGGGRVEERGDTSSGID